MFFVAYLYATRNLSCIFPDAFCISSFACHMHYRTCLSCIITFEQSLQLLCLLSSIYAEQSRCIHIRDSACIIFLSLACCPVWSATVTDRISLVWQRHLLFVHDRSFVFALKTPSASLLPAKAVLLLGMLLSPTALTQCCVATQSCFLNAHAGQELHIYTEDPPCVSPLSQGCWGAQGLWSTQHTESGQDYTSPAQSKP